MDGCYNSCWRRIGNSHIQLSGQGRDSAAATAVSTAASLANRVITDINSGVFEVVAITIVVGGGRRGLVDRANVSYNVDWFLRLVCVRFILSYHVHTY